MVVLSLVLGLVAVTAPVDAAPAPSALADEVAAAGPSATSTAGATASTTPTADDEDDENGGSGTVPDVDANYGDTSVDLPRPVHGATAIRLLGEQVDEAAALNDLETDELVDLLRTDPTAWLDAEGLVFFKDVAVDPQRDLPVPAAAAPLDQTFLLHSRPGAKRTIFLDFDGGNVSGTGWHAQKPGLPTTQPAWRPSGATSGSFNSTDLAAFQAVYEGVAEDYAAFDVDVTTADPGAAAILRSSLSDDVYGSHVLITPDAVSHDMICGKVSEGFGCGGVAYLGVFDEARGPGGDGYGYAQPAWVFPQSAAASVKGVTEAASHEAGHQLSLSHDGNQAGVDNYDTGHGAWAPIMGAGYSHPITQWSKGDYASANNREDDVAILGAKLGVRVDEAPSVIVGAPVKPAGPAYISSRTDVDTYLLGTCSGAVSIAANPLSAMPDLDIKLTLLNAAGSVVATADPASGQTSVSVATGMAASINQTLGSATYYLQVDGVGFGTWANGYDDYGSLGAYTVSTNGCDGAAPTGTPTAPVSVTGTPHASDSTVNLSWAAPASDGGSPVTGYVVTRVGDPTVVQLGPGATSYSWTGLSVSTTYTFKVTALNARGPGPTVSVNATTTNGTIKPGAPQAVSARWLSVAGAAQISYSDPASTGTHAVQQYDVFVDGVFVVSGGSARRSVDVLSSLLTPGTHTLGVAATSFAGQGPVTTVSVEVPARPANDAFAQRTTLSGISGTVTGDNLESSAEVGDPRPPTTRIVAGRASLWYSWTAPQSGLLQLSTGSSVADRDTTLGVYVGTALGSLTEWTGNDDATGKLSSVQLLVTAGTTYSIAVDGFRDIATGVGPFTLSWNFIDDGPKATTTSLAVASSGTTVTLSGSVSATYGAPVGYLEYRRGSAVIGYGDVNTLTTASTLTVDRQPRGEQTYTARFVPDNPSRFVPSSTSQVHTVVGTPTTTGLQATVDARSVTLAVTVSPASATGYVELYDGNVQVGSGQVTTGALAVTLTSVTSGEHSYTAVFSPTESQLYDGSTSAARSVTVEGPPGTKPTTTSLTGSLDGRTATVTATVRSGSGTPSGSVQLTDAGVVVATAPLTDGTATLTAGDLTKGSHTFRATFVPEDPAVYAASQSSNVVLFAQATVTTTELTASVSGRTATLRATVSPTAAAAGGHVRFMEGGTLAAWAYVTDGVAQVSVSGLATGEHTYVAQFYPIDPTRNDYSSSPARTATVLANPTTTVLGSAVVDRQVTLSATVTTNLGSPAGAVQFHEDGTLVGTGTVSGGKASVVLDGVTRGDHVYVATFVPTNPADFAGSVSAAHTAVVTAPRTTTDLTVAVDGRTVTLTSSVSATEGTLDGTVEFREGGTLLGTRPLASGAAELVLSDVGPGPHSYTATFVPSSASHVGSTSPTRTATVFVATATALTATLDARRITLAAEVTGPGSPSGVVRFRDGGVLVGTVPLSGGAATLTLEAVVPGEHTYTATFEATNPEAYGSSTSAPRAVVVDRVATTTTLQATATGRTVTLVASVTASSGAPTGTVELREGASVVATVTLSNGTATRTLNGVAFGPHSYTATFVPTGTVHLGSASASQATTVLGSTTTTLDGSVSGRTVTLTASVASDGTPAVGRVTFYRGTGPFFAADVVAGTVVTTQTNVVPGDYTYTEKFVPTNSANHNASESPATPVTVAKAVSATTLEAAVSNRTVTLDAAVTVPSGAAAGQVRFREGETVVGTVTLSSGAARLTLGTVAPGAHTYTATFVPSDSVTYAGSVSAERSVEVARIATTTGLAAVVDGRTVTLTAVPATTSGTLTGAVELREGDALLDTVPLTGGSSVLALTGVTPGQHSYTATFVPTGTTHAGSTSPTRTVTVAAVATVTGLSVQVSGRTVTLDANVTSALGTPAGDLVLRDGTTVVGTVALVDGAATLELSSVVPGAHSYTATFAPSDTVRHGASQSPARVVTVDPIATTTSLTATYAGGRSLTLEAQVAGDSGTPAGRVVFRDGTTVVGTVDVEDGVASRTLQVSPGEHRYVATFVPTDPVTYGGSASAPRTVEADPYVTSTSLSAVATGGTVALEARTTAGAAGEVVFREGGDVVATVAVTGAAASATLEDVAPGEHTYAATFVPADPATYAGSVSPERTVRVKSPSATALSAKVAGRTVTLTADVTTDGSAAGEVVFREGDTVLGAVPVADAAASLAVEDVTPGEHRYRATFVPASADAVSGSVSPVASATVDPFATSTALGASAEGRTVTLDVEVTSPDGTPTGAVELREGDTLLDTVTLADGGATLDVTDVAPGQHAYTATYVPADAVAFAGSTSAERTVTVAPVATRTALTASAEGRTVTLGAEVTSGYGTPAGEVVLREGSTVLGTVELEDGEAALELTDVDPGEHTYTATFAPSAPATHAVSTSSAQTVAVGAIATETSLSAAAEVRTVTLSAEVTATGGSPAGDVIFREGDQVVGQDDVEDGVASLQLTDVEPGAHAYTATFVPSDDVRHGGSVSAERRVVVDPIATQTALSAAADARTVSLSAEVTAAGGAAAGDVVFREGDEVVGRAALEAGAASLELTDVAPGAHSYTATFVPADDVRHGGSVSAERRVVVDPIATQTALSAAADARTVTLSAEVSSAGGSPAGDVVFREGDEVVGRAALEEGTASLELTGVALGEHVYTATFVPTDEVRHGGSVSAERRVVVELIVTTTTLDAGVDVRRVVLSARVDGASGTPAGDVVFREGDQVVGTSAVEDGAASVELTAATPGQHAYTATFVPADETRFAGSVSAERSVVVEPIVTTTELSLTARAQTVTLDVRVTGASGTPSGDVVLRQGDTVLATLPLTAGGVTFDRTDLDPGEHLFTATFEPSDPATYAASSSGDQSITLGAVATTTGLTAVVDERTVTLTATVSAQRGTPQGWVVFVQDGQEVAYEQLTGDGTASTTRLDVPPGEHVYTARFTFVETMHAESTSPERTVTVSDAAVRTTTRLEASVSGHTVSLTAQVDASVGLPEGSVELRADGVLVETVTASYGFASIQLLDVPTGTHRYVATFVPADARQYAGSSSTAQVVEVAGTPTTTYLSGWATGSTVSLYANVYPDTGTSAPGGTVEFREGDRLLRAVPVTGGVAQLKVPDVLGGTHTYTATYVPSDGIHGGSEASAPTVVAPTSTTTGLTASADGRTVTLAADVDAALGTPTGRIQFVEDSVVQGTVPVNAGRATLSLDAVRAGQHRYAAYFVADDESVHAGSVSPTSTLTVGRSDTASALTVTVADSTVTAQVAVTSPYEVPEGVVVLREGGLDVGSGTVESGAGTVTLTDVPRGRHTYVAHFFAAAGTSYRDSVSASRVAQVGEPDPEAAATATALDVVVTGRSVALSAVVTAGQVKPAGQVVFAEDGVDLGVPVAATGGVFRLPARLATAGQHTYTARFVPADAAAYGSSVSTGRTVTVSPAATSTSLTGSVSGTTMTLNARVAVAGEPVVGGQVQFLEGTRSVGVANLVGERATVLVTGVSVGRHSYTARYLPPTGDHLSSSSTAVSLTVAPAVSRTTVTAPKKAKPGARPVVTVKVLRGAAAAAGQVVLRYGTKSVTLTLRNGAATFKLPQLRAGKLKLTATYRGNATTKTSVGVFTVTVKR
ncbi:Ig-like domain repeat protein [Nocardioides lijunqiniae]|uniref:Ig-like domain repeat protein n=1 Tax=Nocardioides lijunqiniae TaxID=2760832 RepID=UPI0018780D35|nr:Ig-like domain repeat protein [Nocardioides lijunqiniae]